MSRKIPPLSLNNFGISKPTTNFKHEFQSAESPLSNNWQLADLCLRSQRVFWRFPGNFSDFFWKVNFGTLKFKDFILGVMKSNPNKCGGRNSLSKCMHFKSLSQGLLSEKLTNVGVSFLTLLQQLSTVLATSKQFPKNLKKSQNFSSALSTEFHFGPCKNPTKMFL